MEENKNIENQIVSYLAGETDRLPEPEVAEEETFRELKRTWDLSGTAYSFRNSDTEKAWSGIQSKLKTETKVILIRRFNFLRYAAIFIGLLALASITMLLIRNPKNLQEQLVAEGPKMKSVQTVSQPVTYTTIVLPDGSTVKLNANSTLSYPEKFADNERRVTLSGEAYFEVIHNAAHPFVVETNKLKIEDLGTSFNISAYPGRDQVVVNVTTGSVRLSDMNHKELTVLVAGRSGKFLPGKDEVLISDELSSNCLSWITKELSFRRTPLSTVFEELENIYHVPIEIADPKIANIPYTANFDKFQLEDIVNIIAKTHHLSVNKQADRFVFTSK
jgi:ferric-dicitrate binding protein FerR (iron transport regulator)